MIARRDQDIAELVANGISRKFICEKYGVGERTIIRALNKYPVDMFLQKKEPTMVPLVDEADAIRNGLAIARNKIMRYFMRLAEGLPDDIGMMHPGEISKQITSLYPIVKSDYAVQKPTNINFFVSEGKAEDIERKMAEYAMESAKKVEPEK